MGVEEPRDRRHDRRACWRRGAATDFVAAVRALDRVLLSGFYVVPLFHLPEQWVARWTAIERPAVTPLSGYLPETWWRQPQDPMRPP